MTTDAGTQSSQGDVSSSELVQRVYTHLHQLAKRRMAEQPPGRADSSEIGVGVAQPWVQALRS